MPDEQRNASAVFRFSPRLLGSGLPHYSFRDFGHDCVAATSVMVTGVPQGMAYALIAGLPPIYGLYTSIVSCIVGAIFGSSRHLITGPTNASCMVLFSLTAPYIGSANHLEVILLLTFLTGCLKLLFGLFRFGSVVRYVSNSVVMGFTTGVGVLIVGNQLAGFIGIRLEKSELTNFFSVLRSTFQHLEGVNVRSLLIALLTVVIVVGSRRVSKKIPGSLLAVVLSGFIVYWLRWFDHGVLILSDLAPIPRGLEIFHVPELLKRPDLGLIQRLGVGSLALAIFGLLEASTSSRAIANESGQRLDFSREFRAQGLANIVGSFFMNFASSASFVRTAENYHAGARTRVAAVMSGVLTACIVMALAPFAGFIPMSCLSAILLVIAYSLVHKHRILMIWRAGRNSRFVFAVTLLSTIVLPLQYAVFVGIFMSVVFLLKITGKPDLTQLVPAPGGRFEEVPFDDVVHAPIVLVNLEGDLYFAAVEDLDYELQSVLTPETRVVVLRMKRLRAVGSTAMSILERFLGLLEERGIVLVVCGIEPDLQGILTRSGLRKRIGEPNIFYADNLIFRSTELAMARARNILEMQRWGSDIGGPKQRALKVIEARDLMSRQCIRFGQDHSVREAVWLLSEMNRRRESPTVQPLFLQSTDGKLAGMLSPWYLLNRMVSALPEGGAERLSDRDLGVRFQRCFGERIGDLARKDLPRIVAETRYADLLREAARNDLEYLAVLDTEDRVLGLIGQDDLLSGLGKLLTPDPDPYSASARRGEDSVGRESGPDRA